MEIKMQGRRITVWVPVAIATVGALAWWWSGRSKRKLEAALRCIPKAKNTVPLLGRVTVVQAANKGKAHQEFEKILDDMPDETLVRFEVFGKTLVLVGHPSAAEEVLRKNKFIPKLPPAYEGFTFLGSGTRSILAADKEPHERLRSAFQSFFSADNMSCIITQLCSEVNRICDVARAEAKASPDGAAHVNMLPLAVGVIDSVVRKVFFESSQELDLDAFHDALRHIGETALNPMYRSAVRKGLLPSSRRYRRNYKALRANWAALAREAYERPMSDEDGAFWACLRRAYPNALHDSEEWEHVLANTGLMYGAGSETTANAIAMTLTALALDPETMRDLEKELDEAELLQTDTRPDARQPESKDLSSLTLLNAIFHESLRFYPPAAGASARRLDRDLTIGGYALPAGTSLLIPAWALHRSTKIWGKDAKQWRPARWLEDRSVNACKKGPAGGLRWLPFSDGGQNCIGQHIATVELKLAVAMIVSAFKVEADERLTTNTPEEFARACTAFLTLCPRQGAWLKLTPRV